MSMNFRFLLKQSKLSKNKYKKIRDFKSNYVLILRSYSFNNYQFFKNYILEYNLKENKKLKTFLIKKSNLKENNILWSYRKNFLVSIQFENLDDLCSFYSKYTKSFEKQKTKNSSLEQVHCIGFFIPTIGFLSKNYFTILNRLTHESINDIYFFCYPYYFKTKP